MIGQVGRRARREAENLCEAARRERQLSHRALIHYVPELRALDLHERRGGRNRDRLFGHRADDQISIDGRRLGDSHADVVESGALEALRFDSDLVNAGRQQRDSVSAFAIGVGGARLIGSLVGDGNFCAVDDRAIFVL